MHGFWRAFMDACGAAIPAAAGRQMGPRFCECPLAVERSVHFTTVARRLTSDELPSGEFGKGLAMGLTADLTQQLYSAPIV